MLTTYLIIAVILIIALIAVIAVQPAEFTVKRSATIPASSAVLFKQVDDLRLWEKWSPWDRMDPQSKKTFSGPPSGVGASYSWEGPKTGKGTMTTLESRPNEILRFDLHFLKPFKAHNVAEFTFHPVGNETIVTWTMTGRNKFMGKAFGLIMNCDKMIGRDFEKGLANLQEVVKS